jgi:predicted HTH domain antitoxin
MRNEQMVGTRVPGKLVRDLEVIETAEQSDRSTTVRKLLVRAVRDWKLEHYARAYGKAQFTLARAAQAAGVTFWEMTAYLQANKVPAQYDADDLGSDLARIKARLRRGRRR